VPRLGSCPYVLSSNCSLQCQVQRIRPNRAAEAQLVGSRGPIACPTRLAWRGCRQRDENSGYIQARLRFPGTGAFNLPCSAGSKALGRSSFPCALSLCQAPSAHGVRQSGQQLRPASSRSPVALPAQMSMATAAMRLKQLRATNLSQSQTANSVYQRSQGVGGAARSDPAALQLWPAVWNLHSEGCGITGMFPP
jgi:hypothetical protein